MHRAAAFAELGRYPDAARDALAASELRPRDAGIAAWLTYWERFDAPSAIRHAQRALDLGCTDPAVPVNMAYHTLRLAPSRRPGMSLIGQRISGLGGPAVSAETSVQVAARYNRMSLALLHWRNNGDGAASAWREEAIGDADYLLAHAEPTARLLRDVASAYGHWAQNPPAGVDAEAEARERIGHVYRLALAGGDRAQIENWFRGDPAIEPFLPEHAPEVARGKPLAEGELRLLAPLTRDEG
jgi:hypothetical protein